MGGTGKLLSFTPSQCPDCEMPTTDSRSVDCFQSIILEKDVVKMACLLLQSDEGKESVRRRVYERWEESVLTCSSLSQIFLHLASFDKSVKWDRSALMARCRICRRKGDAEKMLLCDGCDRGHHMYCLKPPKTVSLTFRTSCAGFPFQLKVGAYARFDSQEFMSYKKQIACSKLRCMVWLHMWYISVPLLDGPRSE